MHQIVFICNCLTVIYCGAIVLSILHDSKLIIWKLNKCFNLYLFGTEAMDWQATCPTTVVSRRQSVVWSAGRTQNTASEGTNVNFDKRQPQTWQILNSTNLLSLKRHRQQQTELGECVNREPHRGGGNHLALSIIHATLHDKGSGGLALEMCHSRRIAWRRFNALTLLVCLPLRPPCPVTVTETRNRHPSKSDKAREGARTS